MKNKMKQIGLGIAVIAVVATGVFAAPQKMPTDPIGGKPGEG